jgi:hypothetical protein
VSFAPVAKPIIRELWDRSPLVEPSFKVRSHPCPNGEEPSIARTMSFAAEHAQIGKALR